MYHIAEYNGKSVEIDYADNIKQEFKLACMRIIDNGADGIVITPDGKRYAVTQSSRTAKPITWACLKCNRVNTTNHTSCPKCNTFRLDTIYTVD